MDETLMKLKMIKQETREARNKMRRKDVLDC